MKPEMSRDADENLVISNLAPWFIAVLLELPDRLSPDQPDEVRRRLFPDAREDDPEAREEWIRLVHPELLALVASSREIVERDLESLTPGEEPWLASITIPARHVQAWLSALQAARLTLAETHEIGEDELEGRRDPESLDDERRGVLARIDLMGWLQELIITDIAPPPEGEDAD